jgi:ATP-dependent Clp protease ATP-binding subunit ClpC
MFERYTEKARRVIFFARYNANSYGSPYLETEHLLLGLMKENRALVKRFAQKDAKEIRTEVEKQVTRREPVATSTHIPLTNETKDVLLLAVDSADRLGEHRVAPKHLLLGILRVENCGAARILTRKKSSV